MRVSKQEMRWGSLLIICARAVLGDAMSPALARRVRNFTAEPINRKPLSLAEKAKVPITEKVTMGTMFGPVTSTGNEIRYNECLPYPVEVSAVDQVVSVCGTGTRVLIFMRGRCEEYSYYLDEVGYCGATSTPDACMTTSLAETNHWLGQAQSYYIEQCGAVVGEAREMSGPACKGLEECMQHVQDQADAEAKSAAEAAELKKLGIEVDEHGVPITGGGKRKRLKGKFTGRARAASGRKSRAAARMEETKYQRQASKAIGDALAKKR